MRQDSDSGDENLFQGVFNENRRLKQQNQVQKSALFRLERRIRAMCETLISVLRFESEF